MQTAIDNKMQRFHSYKCFLLFVVFGLYSCKSSQRVSSSAERTSNTYRPIATTVKTEKTSTSITKTTAPTKVPENTNNSRKTSGYPAPEYYGNSWNIQHIRLNADPKPMENVQLRLLAQGEKFVMPMCGKILSEFGPRGSSMHTGIDIKLQMDDPVYCAFDGMVRMAKEYAAYGKVVVVRHENGLETVYSHLNSIGVKQDQRVKAGDYLGGGGKTGRATGTHLHFETRFKGEPFNPRLLIDFDDCTLYSGTLALSKDSYKCYGKNLQPATTTSTTTASAPTKTDSGSANIKTHKVEKGDTLYNISKRYNTTVDALRKLNNLSESAAIRIGQVLKIR